MNNNVSVCMTSFIHVLKYLFKVEDVRFVSSTAEALLKNTCRCLHCGFVSCPRSFVSFNWQSFPVASFETISFIFFSHFIVDRHCFNSFYCLLLVFVVFSVVRLTSCCLKLNEQRLKQN